MHIVGPGRWHLINPNAKWLDKSVSLTEHRIVMGPLTIVRVAKGEYGLAVENGKPCILDEGWHVRNDNQFVFNDFVAMNQNHLKHGTIHILRVPEGQCVKVIENGYYKLLLAGTHVINSPLVTVGEFTQLNEPLITHGTLTRFIVKKGEYGLGWNNTTPKIFEEGTHRDLVDLFKTMGIDIGNLMIKTFALEDKKLAEDISRQSMEAVRSQAQVANLVNKNTIAMQEQQIKVDLMQMEVRSEAEKRKLENERDNAVSIKKAEADSKAKLVESQSLAAAQITEARAKADALKIKTEAEAEALKIKTEAEAEALRIKTAVEAERITALGEANLAITKLMQDVPFAMQETFFKLYLESIKVAFSSAKPIYLPNKVAQNPLSFFTPPPGIFNPTGAAPLPFLQPFAQSKEEPSIVPSKKP